MELLMLSPMTPNGRLKTFGSLRNGTLKRSIRNHLGEVICLMASCHPLKESNFVKNNPLFDSFIFLLVYKNVSFWTAPQSPFYLLNWMLPDSNRFLLSLKKVIRLFISIVVTNNKKWELKETTPAHNSPQHTHSPASNEQSDPVPAEPRASSWPLPPQEMLGVTLSKPLLLFS